MLSINTFFTTEILLACFLFQASFVIFCCYVLGVNIFSKDVNIFLRFCRLLLIIFCGLPSFFYNIFNFITFIDALGFFTTFCYVSFFLLLLADKIIFIKFLFFFYIKPTLSFFLSSPMSSRFLFSSGVLVVCGGDPTLPLVTLPLEEVAALAENRQVATVAFSGENLDNALSSGVFGRVIKKDGFICLPDLTFNSSNTLSHLIDDSFRNFNKNCYTHLKLSYDYFRKHSFSIADTGVYQKIRDDSKTFTDALKMQGQLRQHIWDLGASIPINLQHRALTFFSHPLVLNEIVSMQMRDGSFYTSIKANILSHFRHDAFTFFIIDNKLCLKFANLKGNDFLHFVLGIEKHKYNLDNLSRFYGKGCFNDSLSMLNSVGKFYVQTYNSQMIPLDKETMSNISMLFRSIPIAIEDVKLSEAQHVSLGSTEFIHNFKLDATNKQNHLIVFIKPPLNNVYNNLLRNSLRCQQFDLFSKKVLGNAGCDYKITTELITTITKLCKK